MYYKARVLCKISWERKPVKDRGFIANKTGFYWRGNQYQLVYLQSMGCKRLTYQKNNFLRVAYRLKMGYSEKNRIKLYPFGLKHKGYNNVINGTENNYFNYNGKELNQELGLNWLDYGARNYQPDLGRWFNLDPLAETFFEDSPYIYTKNNPILFIDPDGMATTYNWDAGRYEDEDGNEVSWNDVQTEYGIGNSNGSDKSDGKDCCGGISKMMKRAKNAIAHFFGFDSKFAREEVEEAYVSGDEQAIKDALDYQDESSDNLQTTVNNAKDIAELLSTFEPTGISGAYYAYHFGDGTDKALAVVAILPFGKVAKAVKPTGWIVRSTFNSLSPAVKKKMIKAIQTGIVSPKGK